MQALRQIKPNQKPQGEPDRYACDLGYPLPEADLLVETIFLEPAEVEVRDDPDRNPILDYGDMAKAAVTHEPQRVDSTGARRQIRGRLCHPVTKLSRTKVVRLSHRANRVAPRKDPE